MSNLYVIGLNCTTNLRVGTRSKWAAEVFFPEGCVLRISLPIPNEVWFAQFFFLDFFSQLRAAVVRGQSFVKSYEHVTHASVKFVLKLLIISECFDSIIKLAHDTLKELVGSSLVSMKWIATLLKRVSCRINPILFVDESRECYWNKYLRSGWSSLHLLLAGQGLHWGHFRLLVRRQPSHPRRTHYRNTFARGFSTKTQHHLNCACMK